MNERISLLVSDIDGTLVTGDKTLTEGAIAAAAALAHAGVRLSLVSSRPPAGFAMLTGPLSLQAPIGAFNGGAILRPDLGVIESMAVPAEAARIAIETFAAFGVDGWLFTNETWYVSSIQGAYVAKEHKTVRQDPTVVASFEPFYGSVGKLVGSSRDFDLLARCEAELQNSLGTKAAARRSQPYYLDVTPEGADKGYAVTRIAANLGIPLDEVAVIGDMSNDIPMFEVAPHAIAMGNGIDDLKAKARFVTEDNEHDGFAAAVERYILPRSPRYAPSARSA
jgi:Cof subfamily protein (haloacid dehalogenase superfamily)